MATRWRLDSEDGNRSSANIPNRSIAPELVYKCTTILIKISSRFLPRPKQLDYGFIWKYDTQRWGETEKEEGGEGKAQGVTLPDTKTDIKQCVIGT